MIKKYLLLLTAFAALFGQKEPIVTIAKADTTYEFDCYYFCAGDALDWSQFNYDSLITNQKVLSDAELALIDDHKLVSKHDGNYWLHIWLSFEDGIEKRESFVLKHYTFNSAFEVYLNGDKILQNGKIGFSEKDEVTGYYTNKVILDSDKLHSGLNLISIRVSNYTFPTRHQIGYLKLRTVDYDAEQTKKSYGGISMIMTILIFSGVVAFIFYITLGKQLSHLFFTIFCALQSFKMVTKYALFDTSVSLDMSILLYDISGWATIFSYVALIAFLEYELREKPQIKTIVISFFVIGITYIFSWFYHMYELNYISIFCVGSFLFARAIYEKRPKTMTYLFGFLACMLCIYLNYEEKLSWGYFIGIILFIGSMFTASTLQLLQKMRLTHESILRSSRLENQLLKKNIQPHFLMNSLVSLQQLVKEDQPKAMEMIDALADEFHLFTRISENKLIPIEDELSLCKAHLTIMEYRKDAVFKLETEGITGEEEVPPAIFHTLIENGISHGYGSKDEGVFRLKKEKTERGERYSLFNDGDIECTSEIRSNGTGTKYVQARLTESYGTSWTVQSQPVDGGYEVVIEIWSGE